MAGLARCRADFAAGSAKLADTTASDADRTTAKAAAEAASAAWMKIYVDVMMPRVDGQV